MIFEIARIQLENDMDLILAHKRSMKLAELAGLSLSSQTTIATAVSEIARGVIESQHGGVLTLGIKTHDIDHFIVATLRSKFLRGQPENIGINYAKKLVNNIEVSVKNEEHVVEMYYYFAPAFKIDHQRIDEWRHIYRNEPSFSHYDELKKKNEQLLELSFRVQKSEEDYKNLTNSLPLIIFSVDENARLVYANDWLYELTGASPEEINDSDWQQVIMKDDYDAFVFILGCVRNKTDANLKLQCRIKNKNDEYIWHQISISPLKKESVDHQYWTGYMVDIHTQKLLEETLQDNQELKKAQETLRNNKATLEKYIAELNQTNAELQQFAYITSHDLQEPVRKLLFYSDSLLRRSEKLTGEDQKKMLTKIHASSVRMRSLIHDTLLFARIGKEAIKFEKISLNQLLDDVLLEFDTTIQSKNALIEVSDLPHVIGNYSLLGQVFSNLIMNSLKFVQPDLVPKLRIQASTDDGFIEVTVSDNGIGFDQEYHPKIFALFQRLHNRDVYEGTGLGLAICKKIVHLHHGTIRAESTEGNGAVFYVRLPSAETSIYG